MPSGDGPRLESDGHLRVCGSSPLLSAIRKYIMTDNPYYESGETPQIGDIIVVSPKNDFDGYSQLGWRNRKTSTFTVEKVIEGIRSTLVKVVENGPNPRYFVNPMKARNFVLKERAGMYQGQKATPPRFVVINRGKLYGMFTSEEQMKEKIHRLLQANPMEEYHIFEYDTTAKTERPTVQFVNQMNTENSSIVEPSIRRPTRDLADDEKFTSR